MTSPQYIENSFLISHSLVWHFERARKVYEGWPKFFHVETNIFAKRIFRQTLTKSMFICSVTCCPTLVRKTLMWEILKLVHTLARATACSWNSLAKCKRVGLGGSPRSECCHSAGILQQRSLLLSSLFQASGHSCSLVLPFIVGCRFSHGSKAAIQIQATFWHTAHPSSVWRKGTSKRCTRHSTKIYSVASKGFALTATNR